MRAASTITLSALVSHFCSRCCHQPLLPPPAHRAPAAGAAPLHQPLLPPPAAGAAPLQLLSPSLVAHWLAAQPQQLPPFRRQTQASASVEVEQAAVQEQQELQPAVSGPVTAAQAASGPVTAAQAAMPAVHQTHNRACSADHTSARTQKQPPRHPLHPASHTSCATRHGSTHTGRAAAYQTSCRAGRYSAPHNHPSVHDSLPCHCSQRLPAARLCPAVPTT